MNKLVFVRNQLFNFSQAGCSSFLTLCSTPNTGLSMTGKTRLDKEKLAQNQHELESIGGQARAWRTGITRATVREKYRGGQGFLDRLRRLSEDPQHALPDIFIWMISGGRRVAYHRIKARTLLYRWEQGCKQERVI